MNGQHTNTYIAIRVLKTVSRVSAKLSYTVDSSGRYTLAARTDRKEMV